MTWGVVPLLNDVRSRSIWVAVQGDVLPCPRPAVWVLVGVVRVVLEISGGSQAVCPRLRYGRNFSVGLKRCQAVLHAVRIGGIEQRLLGDFPGARGAGADLQLRRS